MVTTYECGVQRHCGGSTIKRLLIGAVTLLLASPVYAQLEPSNDIGVTYGHVHLNVSDMELHKQLWVDHFGGVLVPKGPLTAIRLPGMLIALSDREPTSGSQGTVMDHFGFKVRDIEAVLSKWRAAGLPVMSEFTGAEGLPNAYVMAPDDVRVELQEDTTLPVEIAAYHSHFFTPEHEDLLDWYIETFGLQRFKRGRIETTENAPGMNLSFGSVDVPRAWTRGTAIDHIGFEIDDLESFCTELEARGIELDVPFREIPSIGLKIAFLTDPSGVYVELTEGYDEY